MSPTDTSGVGRFSDLWIAGFDVSRGCERVESGRAASDSGAVDRHTVTEAFDEQAQNLTRLRVAPGTCLGVERLAVNDDIEHPSSTGDERQRLDHVLIVREEILRRAHGASRIVSRYAIRDGDDVLVGHEPTVPILALEVWRPSTAG